MSGHVRDGVLNELLEPILQYGCSHWRNSSQRAAVLYDSGAKLWRKEELKNIEEQLAQSCTVRMFTVRRFDGRKVHIRNPMFGVKKPIWKPYVKFQDYWCLVHSKPDVSVEACSCTYLVDWTNQTVRNYEGPIQNPELLFANSRQQWHASAAFQAFIPKFFKLLEGDGNATKKVTKIVCFGLGDMNSRPSTSWIAENASKPENEQLPETYMVESSFMHHAIAWTIADIARACASAGNTVRLLTQDPDYSPETKETLQKVGWEVVGEHGAGGFAELDDESIVFSPFASAPVKQIIADLARPVAIICAESSGGVFNRFEYVILLLMP
ncbi:hypothetical protein EV127DRAFT_343418 [Xylaria flabelliformis]|nr:hypothetical protein EV127DRAFT_343418 [Xylaria flabelliformis]